MGFPFFYRIYSMSGIDPTQQSSFQYHQSKLITIPHGMFNRCNGFSLPPFSSLNFSYGVGDDPQLVTTNRRHVKQALNISFLVSAKQTHGKKIYCCSDITSDKEVDDYDALITNQRGVGLLIQQADCQAILIHDPNKQVIAAIHCGWRGSTKNIIGSTIAKMMQRYQTDPKTVLVTISPSLGPCCAEFINYEQELPKQLHQFQHKPYYFNFWDMSTTQLVEAGVAAKHIDATRICTACNHDYFSYRRTNKRSGEITTGRNGSIICLPLT